MQSRKCPSSGVGAYHIKEVKYDAKEQMVGIRKLEASRLKSGKTMSVWMTSNIICLRSRAFRGYCKMFIRRT
jgi:hypothetical protein